jgi:hypothetical protein
VFGVLNMLVSVASFLPILVVGPIGDLLGTTVVLVLVGFLIVGSGVASIYLRGPLRAVERDSRATVGGDRDPFVTALGVEARPGDYDPDGEPMSDARDEDPTAPSPIAAAATGPLTADPVTAAEATPEVTEVVTRGSAEADEAEAHEASRDDSDGR